MQQGMGDPIVLNDEILALRQSVNRQAAILQRVELKLDALCQLLRDNGTISSDDYKRLALWGTEGTR